MSATESFVAEICMFPFNFPPKGWAFCNGQLLSLTQNIAVFALLGTTFGGNGETNFGLPDLQGRVPLQPGQGQGLSLRDLGETGGEEFLTLLATEMPLHSHPVSIKIPVGGTADTDSPYNAYPATFAAGEQVLGNPAELYASATSQKMGAVNSETIALAAGGGLPHNNIQPTLFINYCIALQGIFPPRS